MASSLPSRTLQVLVSPGRLFEELREEPRGLWIIVVSGLVVVGATALIPTEAWEAMLRSRTSMVPSGEVPVDPAEMAGVVRWTGVAGAALLWGVWALALGGVATLVFAFILGDEGRFKQYLAVAGHAMVPVALGTALTLPLKIIETDAQLSLTLASFAVFLDEGYALRFLGTLDLFALWATVVMALGVSRIDPERSWAGATAILLSLYAVLGLLLAIPGG